MLQLYGDGRGSLAEDRFIAGQNKSRSRLLDKFHEVLQLTNRDSFLGGSVQLPAAWSHDCLLCDIHLAELPSLREQDRQNLEALQRPTRRHCPPRA